MKSENIDLKRKASLLKRDIIDMMYKGGWEYPYSALSSANIVTALYFKAMNIKPEEPNWEDRDRIILSNKDACPAVYAALAQKGYYNKSWIYTFRQLGSKLQGNPDMNKTQGIDITTGTIGNGVSIGIGMAAALKLKNRNSKVFVLMDNREIYDGMVWEAAMSASELGLDNLIAILDYSHSEAEKSEDGAKTLEPLVDKWKAFGWRVFELNGHNMQDILDKIEMACMPSGKPNILIAHTLRYKTTTTIVDSNSYSMETISEEQYIQLMRELSQEGKEEE